MPFYYSKNILIFGNACVSIKKINQSNEQQLNEYNMEIVRMNITKSVQKQPETRIQKQDYYEFINS